MSWKFKASKYKNAVPIEAKKELQIRQLSIGAYNTGKNKRRLAPPALFWLMFGQNH